jgi:cytochrome c553
MKRMLSVVVVASLAAIAASAAEAAGDVAAGKTKSAVCVGGHGANGQGGPAESRIEG